MLQKNIIPTKRFLKCVKNTINDLKEQNYEGIKHLREIIRTKQVNLISATALYEILELRKEYAYLIVSEQGKHDFKIVNKEHNDIELFLDAHFINGLEIHGNRITGYVSYKEVL